MRTSDIQQSYLFHIGIILIPFIEFINTNFHDLDFVLVRSTFIIFLLISITIAIFAKLISSFIKKINFQDSNFIISVIFFSSFFIYTFLKDIFHILTPVYNGEIAFISIVLFLILFYLFFFYQKNIIFIRFVLVYICLCFLLNALIFIINITSLYNNNYSTSNFFFSKSEINNIIKNKNKNIYYVILDAALPLDKFDDFFQTNHYKTNKKIFNNLNYEIIKNSKSSYNQTKYTLTAILNLSYFINMENYKSIKSTKMYPGILSENNVWSQPLIRTLDKIQYEFKWIGTYNKNCKLYNNNLCLNYKKSEKKTSNIISNYVFYSFLGRSPIIPIQARIYNLFFKKEINKGNINFLYDENNAIKKFMKNITKNNIKTKNYFFFIHNQAPHEPYVYNSDCSINTSGKLNWMEYKKNYECALKSLIELIFWIDQNDPEAIVVVQSDHSMAYDVYKSGDRKATFSQYDIFNLIKINKSCRKFLSNNVDQVNGVRLALSCAVNQNVNLLEKKKYFVDFKKGNVSIGGTFKIKEIRTFEEERSVREGK
tara:strand:+ start:323 stop:1942 length:1620 start_codon:yes stop_codon:yes gene_type:complete